MIERHQDYVFALGEMVEGEVYEELIQPLDADGPFILRALGGYYITDAGTADESTNPLPGMLMFRFADADGNWLQTHRAPGLLDQPGGPTDFRPLRRHVTYPARSTIRFQVENISGGTLSGIVLLFRGVKLFPGGYGEPSPVYCPTYPGCYACEPFQYVVNFDIAAGAELLNVPITMNGDAAFAWRGTLAVADPTAASNSLEVLEVRTRDPWNKAFASTGANGGAGAWVRAPRLFSAVPSAPGLWYPELYIDKSEQFQLDLRNVGVGLAATGQIALEGVKVFAR